ncbi:MAG: DUF4346 domain-containing protein [Firmicutes bacterium]|nr:DUF4346 domain-containing protein [Bacillota bacterium]
MEFIPLYYGDKLNIVNKNGYVGVITLWSKISFVKERLAKQGVDLNPTTSPIVAIGNLYGNGLKHLLRNLAYNPQITDLCVCGKNRSGSLEELINFFRFGVENVELLGFKCQRIINTKRTVDLSLNPSLFTRKPNITYIGDLVNNESIQELSVYFKNISPAQDEIPARLKIELPEVEVSHYPSNARSHVIVRDTPMQAWKQLIFCIVRFGHLVQLKKGERQELQNVKVVVERPEGDNPKELEAFGFDLQHFRAYQNEILDASMPASDTGYTYGNRIRGYFGIDTLNKCVEKLNNDYQDRHCFITLWDNKVDLQNHSCPCLVSLFFRVFEEKLTLAATFRTHNVMDAWLENFYVLMAILNFVSAKTGIAPGSITVFSHSITIDTQEYERAKGIANQKGFELHFDPHGQFEISIEDDEIVMYHLFGDTVISEYRGKKAERLQYELSRDCAISDINHAIYIGRQLARAEMCLASGAKFVQE